MWKPTVGELLAVLAHAWAADTAKGDWSPDCPMLNQCAVTALVVQDWLGGDLLRCLTAKGDSHYWNQLPNGKEVDLTAGQFVYSGDEPLRSDTIIRTREYVLSFPDTVARYEILKRRVRLIWMLPE